jgi:hypothetical protein
MNKSWRFLYLLLSLIMLLAACQSNTKENQDQPKSIASGHTHLNDAAVIPSVDSTKIRTTNEHGGTSYGMGSSVYSMIGSSGLHSDGFSKHLESRLSGAGIDGVKVLVIDDMVILAAESRTSTASQYDPVQQKVLSITGGQSGRGPEPNSPPGTLGSGGAIDNNLDMAANRIKDFMGGNVKVLTVTGSEAVNTIQRIQDNAGGSSMSAQVLSDNIRTILQLALVSKK